MFDWLQLFALTWAVEFVLGGVSSTHSAVAIVVNSFAAFFDGSIGFVADIAINLLALGLDLFGFFASFVL